MLQKTALQRTKRVWWDFKELVKYKAPDLRAPRVPMTPRATKWFSELNEKGLVRIEGEEFLKLAQYVNQNYFDRIAQKNGGALTGAELGNPLLYSNNNLTDLYRAYGTTVLQDVSFRDPQFDTLFLNEEIASVVYNYYRRQPFYRNQPVLEEVAYKTGMDATLGNKFHVDHLHQLSFMLLLTDQTENDTHMQYILRGHRRSLLAQGIYLSFEECAAYAERHKRDLYKLTGQTGTLFIFDTISPHRRNLQDGRTRRMLHANITTGHHLGRFQDDRKNWPAYDKASMHLREMFRYLK